MTNEAYTMTQTNKERRSMSNGARARKCGSKSKRCTLPSDNLTAAQKRKLNGPVETVNLNQPLTYDKLIALSPTLRFLYLDTCINKHKARRLDIVAMLGCAQATFTKLLPTLPGKLIFHGKPRSPAPEWLAFLGGAAPDPEPADDLRAVAATTPEPEPEKVDVNPPQPIVIQAGSFTIQGNLLDLAAAIARFIDNPDQTYTFTLSFTK